MQIILIGAALIGLFAGAFGMRALPEAYQKNRPFFALAAIAILITGASGQGFIVPADANTYVDAYVDTNDGSGIVFMLARSFFVLSLAFGVLIGCLHTRLDRIIISAVLSGFTLLPGYLTWTLMNAGQSMVGGGLYA